MTLTVNVSNSNITFCIWENRDVVCRGELHTDASASAEELAVRLQAVFSLYNHTPAPIDGVILSCVVPAFLMRIRRALELLFSCRIYTVGPGLKSGISIRTDDPAQLGSELVSCAVAVLEESVPCVIISMDTATTFTAVDEKGVLRGGAIAPGVQIGAQALCRHTAQLPQIDLAAQVERAIGTNSVASMQAGVLLGAACLVDGMIDRFADELKAPAPTVFATGTLAPHILPHCRHTILLRPNLVHEGLFKIFEKNQKL